uniref:Uncharacterized protein n=1 Tax=Anopheles culicifacies TaxID=139723 RepID=A0A182MSD1_9DIPT
MDTDRCSTTTVRAAHKANRPTEFSSRELLRTVRKTNGVQLNVNPCRRPQLAQPQQPTGDEDERRRKRRKRTSQPQLIEQTQLHPRTSPCPSRALSYGIAMETGKQHHRRYGPPRKITQRRALVTAWCVGLMLLHLVSLAASTPMSIKLNDWQRVAPVGREIEKENFGTGHHAGLNYASGFRLSGTGHSGT